MTVRGRTVRERLVVVGNGMAATRLVEDLVRREAPYDITVIGDEPHPAYNRILLSAVLEEAHRPEDIWLHEPRWYDDHGVRLLLGQRAVRVDRERRRVGLSDGGGCEYDRLVFATGARPVLPPIRGIVDEFGGLRPDVHAFRSYADYGRLREAASTARRAVVVGGGLLGLQVGRALSVVGVDTEIVEVGPMLMARQLGGSAARVLERQVRRLGTEVYTGARAARLTADGMLLDNGYALTTDLVVLACGSRPASRLAERAGLFVRRGVVVDDRLTSIIDDRVHAIGDCAEHRARIHGFVGPAWEQATTLARVLCGEDAGYSGSRIVARLRANGLDVAVLGEPETTDGEVVEVANPLAGTYRKLVVKDGVVAAGVLLGDLSRIGVITQHYDRQTALGAAEPGGLLLGDSAAAPVTELPDDAQVCVCAGVSAGRIRRCRDVSEAVATTRATTGCGSCAGSVAQLVDAGANDGSHNAAAAV
ncbi:MAG: NAD(P)/FAD-dependent oxidoreductase [Propionibacteriales bacterium]|nr:NAD(P)/FAD-dependent oxidoreductase [Propionibacteriales bacterium]